MESTNSERIKNQTEKTWHELLRNVGIILKLKKSTEMLNQQFDDSFTVFSALGFEEKELKHCQIIYALINPKGRHGMGDAFLRLFFEIVMTEKYESATVNSEYSFRSDNNNSGRIDLYISTPNSCYPIEVKINANDQETQIYRYHKFAKDSNKNKFTVFYLTLNGKQPSSKSTNGMTDEDLNSIKCISFRKEILSWLRNCAELAYQRKKISIYGAIHQYATLIEKLTIKQQVQEDDFMNSITEVMALSEQYFEAAKFIAENFKKVQPQKMNDLLKKIEKKIETHLINKIPNFNPQYVSSSEKFYSDKTNYVQLKFELSPLRNDISLKLIFEIVKNGDDRFYYGVVPEFADFFTDGKYDGEKHCKLIQERKNDIAGIFNNDNWQQYVRCIPKGSFWVWRKCLPSKEEQPNFIECDENYLKLYNPDDYEKFLNKIFAEIDDNLQYILKCGVPKDLPNNIEKL